MHIFYEYIWKSVYSVIDVGELTSLRVGLSANCPLSGSHTCDLKMARHSPRGRGGRGSALMWYSTESSVWVSTAAMTVAAEAAKSLSASEASSSSLESPT